MSDNGIADLEFTVNCRSIANMKARVHMHLIVLAGILLPVTVSSGQPPAPSWVQMFDQGEADAQLKGIHTPRGIKVDIVGQQSLSGRPMALAFGNDGTLFVLLLKETKEAQRAVGELVALRDSDGDGRFDKLQALFSDIVQPHGMCVDAGWIFLATGKSIVRRRPFDAEILTQLQDTATSRHGPPTALTADKKWIEQQLVSGLDMSTANSAGGLAASPDGWLYMVCAGRENRPTGWDGLRAVVLRSGAVFRSRHDGSQVQEFSRGLDGPRGAVAEDVFGNLFCCDVSGEKLRLIHLLEGADYGWRSDLKPPRPDRPGTLPAIQSLDAGQPEAATVLRGMRLPKSLAGLLLVTDPKQRRVRAFSLKRSGCTFEVSAQFDLFASDDENWQMLSVSEGLDGAIYILAWHDKTGPAKRQEEKDGCRIYRLSWSGIKDIPAIPFGPLARKADAPPPSREQLVTAALDVSKPLGDRAAALAAAGRVWDKSVEGACLTILDQEQPELQRLATEALGDHLPADRAAQESLAEHMQDMLLRAPLPVQRSLYLALGKMGTKLDSVPEWLFEATSVTATAQKNRHLFDAHVRALELPKGWGTELLVGNLEVALFDPNTEPEERQRLKNFVVATAEAMRTGELARFLDKALTDERDYFSKLDGPLQVRVLAAYRSVLVEPPIHADAVAAWLEKHPAASPDVQQAAWQVLASVGTSKPEPTTRLARQLLSGKFDPALHSSVVAALERHVQPGKRGEVDELLDALRKLPAPSSP